MSSLQTTLARGLVRQLEAQWAAHKPGCPKCAHRRERCRAGEQIYGQLIDARADLKWQRECDKQPSPDQGALF